MNPNGLLAHLLQTPLIRTVDYNRVNDSRWRWKQGHSRTRWSVELDGPIRERVYILTPGAILRQWWRRG